jgi:peptide-methionine (R)-S-oxide reductase
MRLRESIRIIIRNMGRRVESGVLSSSQIGILRGGYTERAGSSELLKEKRDGSYSCVGCGSKLFSSDVRFDSGSGWPSFWDAVEGSVVMREEDDGRVEVSCSECGGHLGHVFEDGPKPTGKRFCVNGDVLKFEAKE